MMNLTSLRKLKKTFLISLVAACVATPAIGFAAPTSLDLTGTIRDFNDTHADFEGLILGHETDVVKSTLGLDGKPDWNGPNSAQFSNAANFNEWYNDTAGVNLSKSHTISLTDPDSDGVFTFADSSFFPVDGDLFGNQGRSHNYHFTFELHSEFTYTGGETFSFTGDDDVWVFINNELVVDLGGVHGAINGSVDLDTLGLTTGTNYDFDLFFAERHTSASNFRMDTSIALTSTPMPEPGILALLSLGLVGIGVTRRSRNSRK